MTNKFLNKLIKEGKLGIVEPSEDICNSYLEKSANCLKSAKLLSENNLYENSISMSYYAMYNLLLALLFRVGIKCENHNVSILLLKLLFCENGLYKLISDAKNERIDKQYYVTKEKDEITGQITDELIKNAEYFILKLKVVIRNLNNDTIEDIIKRFKMIGNSRIVKSGLNKSSGQ